VWRKKRSIVSSYSNIRNHDTLQEELIDTWETLERTVNRSISIDVDSCIKGTTNKKWRSKSSLLPKKRENNIV